MAGLTPAFSTWADVFGAVAVTLLAATLFLVRRLRGSVRHPLRELQETLEQVRAHAGQLSSRLVQAERAAPSASPFVGVMTRRLGAIDAIALSLARDLRRAVQSGDMRLLDAAARRSLRRAEDLAALAAGGRARERQTHLPAVWPRVPGLLGAKLAGQTLRTSFPADLPPVVGGGETWVQMLAALVENAAEAAPTGGLIEVGATLSATRPGQVDVWVADRGRGIAADVLPTILEPVFGDDGEGETDALGIAMVGALVESLGGTIEVASKVGEGTRVDLVVPEARDGAAAASLPAFEGTVLVADDDPIVRAATTRVLQRLGLEVIGVDGGSAAKAALMGGGDRFRAAVLDVVMPGTPVDELVAFARQQRPDFPVLLVSGYDTMGMVDPLLAMGGVRFVPKPYSIELLAHSLDDLFSASRSAN